MNRKVLLNDKEVQITLHRLACQLIENHHDFSNTVLIGLQPRGTFLAKRLKAILSSDYNISQLVLGFLDITFYRDDFRRGDKPLQATTTDIDFIIENKKVVFIDDVLYTGRSIRAALTAIQSFGRPSEIELLTLIDLMQKLVFFVILFFVFSLGFTQNDSSFKKGEWLKFKLSYSGWMKAVPFFIKRRLIYKETNFF